MLDIFGKDYFILTEAIRKSEESVPTYYNRLVILLLEVEEEIETLSTAKLLRFEVKVSLLSKIDKEDNFKDSVGQKGWFTKL